MQTFLHPVRRKRRPDSHLGDMVEHDPLAGMANLFDAAIVFALAFMVALLISFGLGGLLSPQHDIAVVRADGPEHMEIVLKKAHKVERYRVTSDRLRGEGERLGVAYRLKSGDVVFVPDMAE